MKLTPLTEFSLGATQSHYFAAWQQEARESLDRAANALAPLSQSDTIEPARRQRGTEELSANRAIDLASMAVVAEAVVLLVPVIDQLRAEVAALQDAAAGKG